MAQKITAEMIDWESYKEHLENSIANERIWGLGGSEFADENIEEYEEELYSIEKEYYFDILDKYEDDYLEEFLL